jgi:hypothetical protein
MANGMMMASDLPVLPSTSSNMYGSRVLKHLLICAHELSEAPRSRERTRSVEVAHQSYTGLGT